MIRSFIGDYCIIAAQTLVGDGKEIPARSLVMGVPAQIKGEPTEHQFWWPKHSFEAYQNRILKYIKSGN